MDQKKSKMSISISNNLVFNEKPNKQEKKLTKWYIIYC